MKYFTAYIETSTTVLCPYEFSVAKHNRSIIYISYLWSLNGYLQYNKLCEDHI